jgi:hypothetical protein
MGLATLFLKPRAVLRSGGESRTTEQGMWQLSSSTLQKAWDMATGTTLTPRVLQIKSWGRWSEMGAAGSIAVREYVLGSQGRGLASTSAKLPRLSSSLPELRAARG